MDKSLMEYYIHEKISDEFQKEIKEAAPDVVSALKENDPTEYVNLTASQLNNPISIYISSEYDNDNPQYDIERVEIKFKHPLADSSNDRAGYYFELYFEINNGHELVPYINSFYNLRAGEKLKGGKLSKDLKANIKKIVSEIKNGVKDDSYCRINNLDGADLFFYTAPELFNRDGNNVFNIVTDDNINVKLDKVIYNAITKDGININDTDLFNEFKRVLGKNKLNIKRQYFLSATDKIEVTLIIGNKRVVVELEDKIDMSDPSDPMNVYIPKIEGVVDGSMHEYAVQSLLSVFAEDADNLVVAGVNFYEIEEISGTSTAFTKDINLHF